MLKKHNIVVRKQFARTADAFSKFATRDSDEILAERIEFANPQAGELALDVACGPGTLVLALAARVLFARGIDITHAMLVQAGAFRTERGIANACFDEGDAEHLPYADACFDLVTCQFALHHMLRPQLAIREMGRVLRPGGRLLIADTLGPESEDKWELHNSIERMRDPSHVDSLRLTALLKLFEEAHLSAVRQSLKPRPRYFDRWMLRAGIEPSHPRYKEVRYVIEDAIPGDRAGFAARFENGELVIADHEAMFLLGRSGR